MPMNIRVCAKCGKPISHVNCMGYCGECKDYTYPASINIVTVHTTAELKHAKIKAYQDVLDACNKTESLDCIKDFIEEKIYSVEKKMEG